ncbi:MAG: isoprenylcysteine carboxylmethyltransferase family protein [Chloroflexi bacterium]|nr:isoprenylcysteine carboxylmethyltransferase family protein [Chloroflexota bacterium]
MLERIPTPPRPAPRLSLLTIPMSLLSFERRQRLPRLPGGRSRWLGVPLLAAGFSLFLWSMRTLRREGEGTPHPADPPRRLVIAGPYRFTRNPMAIAALLNAAGAALLLRSVLLLLYVPALALWTHLYLVREEEPQLEQRFGEQYEEYSRRVPRWLPLPRVRREQREEAQV